MKLISLHDNRLTVSRLKSNTGVKKTRYCNDFGRFPTREAAGRVVDFFYRPVVGTQSWAVRLQVKSLQPFVFCVFLHHLL